MPIDDRTAVEALAACEITEEHSYKRLFAISCAVQRLAGETGSGTTALLDLTAWIEDGRGSVIESVATFDCDVWPKLLQSGR